MGFLLFESDDQSNFLKPRSDLADKFGERVPKAFHEPSARCRKHCQLEHDRSTADHVASVFPYCCQCASSAPDRLFQAAVLAEG
mgnify:CR=1 FL=1